MSLIGNHLYEELRRSEYVGKLVGIDRADIYDNYNIEIRKNTDNLNDLDIIIVATLTDQNGI